METELEICRANEISDRIDVIKAHILFLTEKCNDIETGIFIIDGFKEPIDINNNVVKINKKIKRLEEEKKRLYELLRNYTNWYSR